MEVTYGSDTALSAGQCYFPPALLGNPKDILEAYFHFVVKGLKNTAKHQDNQIELSELSKIGKHLDFKEETYD